MHKVRGKKYMIIHKAKAVGNKEGIDILCIRGRFLGTETVEGAAGALEGVDDVEGGDGLALGVLSVGDGVTDDTLEEGLENTTGLLVDH